MMKGDFTMFKKTKLYVGVSLIVQAVTSLVMFFILLGKKKSIAAAFLALAAVSGAAGGYLLYASLFAAVGSAVENETDTQQFSLPLTIPIIFAIYAAIYSAQNPDGPLAFWCSLIPFTSPVVMMVRLPFGVPFWQVALSIGILVLSFVLTTWMAGKIYRTGILMYGKKVTWAELWKWLKY